MEEKATEVLEILEEKGYEAYIIGGYVRDKILSRESIDIDICTNATPKQIVECFKNIELPKEAYGSIHIFYKGVRFEITTYRKDINYHDNRRPETVVYIQSLKEDIERRDFTMNTLCQNKDGVIIDILNGKQDILNHKIKTVGDPFIKFEEDALRILRAIRFATVLNFELDEKVKKAIKKKAHLLKNISYYRKKEELDKIFGSTNVEKGIHLLTSLKVDHYLELKNLKNIKLTNDILGIWCQIYNENYPFTKIEKETIEEVKTCQKLDVLDSYILYQKGPYILSLAAHLKGIPKQQIIEKYDALAIKKRKDIDIDASKITRSLNKQPGAYLKTIYETLEKEILYQRLQNKEENILKYLKDKSF